MHFKCFPKHLRTPLYFKHYGTFELGLYKCDFGVHQPFHSINESSAQLVYLSMCHVCRFTSTCILLHTKVMNLMEISFQLSNSSPLPLPQHMYSVGANCAVHTSFFIHFALSKQNLGNEKPLALKSKLCAVCMYPALKYQQRNATRFNLCM